ncbi:hypothetical protein [Dictyobacter formicarum]|uniref:Uncharacterized protein n=1 Tax=Dictyobacter formicarum TaxID=2778368 RepID=A0ABQ3VPC6_9CHLR|nr:hypothetical protein [Dictyobacter formicarum]GHO87697.1 hypothetical protein KSZ_57030 [Dictyobacter formicarum]
MYDLMQFASREESRESGFVPPYTNLPGRCNEPKSVKWAYRLFWFTFVLFFAGTGSGKLWDRVWHATRRFDTFWSPPHFFVFVVTACTGALVAVIALTPSLSIWFGPAVSLPRLHFRVPAALMILGSGLVLLCITITLDNFWHTAFGLDETQWSVPHDMLGWCWFTIIFGFAASRLAFRRYRPLSWFTNIVIAVLIIEFMCPPMLGPFYLNYSPHLLHALANLPVVRKEPDAQHMYRIYLNHGLTRQTCPLFIPQVAFFAGAALALLRRIDRRLRIFLLAPLFWSCFTATRDLYTIFLLRYHEVSRPLDVVPVALHEPSLWVPIPLFLAAVVFELCRRLRFSESCCYIMCGAIFSLCTFAIWHTTLWMLLLVPMATGTLFGGSRIGNWFYSMLNKPTLDKLTTFLLIFCAQIPTALGVIDLILRRTTP